MRVLIWVLVFQVDFIYLHFNHNNILPMSNTHGGKREGSGRKKKDTSQLSLKVPNKIIENLNSKYTTIKDRNIEIIKALKKISK